MDHPRPDDDRGTVAVVDLEGNKRTLTAEWIGEQGLSMVPGWSERYGLRLLKAMTGAVDLVCPQLLGQAAPPPEGSRRFVP